MESHVEITVSPLPTVASCVCFAKNGLRHIRPHAANRLAGSIKNTDLGVTPGIGHSPIHPVGVDASLRDISVIPKYDTTSALYYRC